MELDADTANEIRAILARDCIVEVTVTFYDDSENGGSVLEPIDIGTTADFERNTPSTIQRASLDELIESLRGIFHRLTPSSPP